MARSSDGTCTKPGTDVVSATPIDSALHNSTVNDTYSLLSDSLSRSGSGAMTAGLKSFDGTESLPGVAFANDLTSGLYRAGAGDVRMGVSATAGGITKWLAASFSVLKNFILTGNLTLDGAAGQTVTKSAGDLTFNTSGAGQSWIFKTNGTTRLTISDTGVQGPDTPTAMILAGNTACTSGGTTVWTVVLDASSAYEFEGTLKISGTAAPTFSLTVTTGGASVARDSVYQWTSALGDSTAAHYHYARDATTGTLTVVSGRVTGAGLTWVDGFKIFALNNAGTASTLTFTGTSTASDITAYKGSRLSYRKLY